MLNIHTFSICYILPLKCNGLLLSLDRNGFIDTIDVRRYHLGRCFHALTDYVWEATDLNLQQCVVVHIHIVKYLP